VCLSACSKFKITEQIWIKFGICCQHRKLSESLILVCVSQV